MENFKAFDREFLTEYSEFSQKFPLLFLCLERELRKEFDGREELHQRSLASLSNSRNGFFKNIIIKAYLFYVCRWGRLNSDTMLVNISFNKYLSEKVSASFENVESLSDKKFFNIPISKILNRAINIDDVICDIYGYVKKNNIGKLRQDFLSCESFEKRLVDNTNILKTLFKKVNIKYLVLDGDGPPVPRLLCQCARDLDIPSVIFAHGFVQDPKLITIAPLKADIFFSWSEGQAEWLREETKDNRFLHYGFFLETAVKKNPKYIFICESMIFAEEAAERVSQISWMSSLLEKKGYKVKVRFHPKNVKERSPVDLIFLAESKGLKVSSGDLKEDLAEAVAVISSGSSVLVQAAIYGVPAFHVTSEKATPFYGAKVLKCGQVDEINLQSTACLRGDAKPFNFDKIKEIIDTEVGGRKIK